MTTNRHRTKIAEIKRQEQVQKVTQILLEHKDGLTSFQIAIKMGDGLPRDLLLKMQKEGLIKQKKGISADGRLAILYVLRAAKPSMSNPELEAKQDSRDRLLRQGTTPAEDKEEQRESENFPR